MDSDTLIRPAPVRDDAYFRLRAEVEEFFYDEASMLDERRFDEWLDLMHDDIVYFMPMRRNVKFGMHEERENTRIDEGISWFNEDKWTLQKRVEQILTGVHYAEEPLSRVAHLITNVQVRAAFPSVAEATEIETSCRFHVYQNRVEHEHYSFVGRRYDTLKREEGGFRLLKRKIILDQNVLLAKCLTAFF
ncbi:3-phenylpropionate/cinnamic acid dioxygenase subunit beta [Psychromarinibacter halotolerans]|uniref:3-phenylpropionate/cinnamic acid dioxygenase subunit beta n=1 Tax=Psychromarinibacter halotolerans TaxID=1775175 RepID=A0ABV7GIL1_9RHOB|nr:3-phenylpropionate/cinnamic acid dioxygenase subunit beta [Psychromarinibacter halotolerans]MDF0599045.1 3-phenylpropionate/cinnamic acid dioxygenase subunit beta [Psychromarinibacter halotolerans]